MKICVAQSHSFKGKVQENIENHLRIILLSVEFGVGLIVFPELSVTSYEPELAKDLATDPSDKIFDPFQELSNTHDLSIGIGMPIKADDGINISMIIFQPHRNRSVYSKEILHPDELPFFTSGKGSAMTNINGTKIAFGICYETLQREHFLKAKENQAEIYIASVAKPDRGIDKAYLHFPGIARGFKTPILMSNSVGFCDNFLSNGKSSVWNSNGELIGQLDEENQGILIYDTELDSVETVEDFGIGAS